MCTHASSVGGRGMLIPNCGKRQGSLCYLWHIHQSSIGSLFRERSWSPALFQSDVVRERLLKRFLFGARAENILPFFGEVVIYPRHPRFLLKNIVIMAVLCLPSIEWLTGVATVYSNPLVCEGCNTAGFPPQIREWFRPGTPCRWADSW